MEEEGHVFCLVEFTERQYFMTDEVMGNFNGSYKGQVVSDLSSLAG